MACLLCCFFSISSYEEEDENAYCHHDILLPSFPLCMAWMEFNPATGLPGIVFSTFETLITGKGTVLLLGHLSQKSKYGIWTWLIHPTL